MAHNDRLPVAGGDTRLIIDGENVPFGAYQAIYHKITKKTERLNQSYRDAYTIRREDLFDLHTRLKQALTQYQIAGSHTEITHSLTGGQSLNFSSFEKFSISDGATNSCTKLFNYVLSFLIILPAEIPEAEDIPQRYKVSILIEPFDSALSEDDEEPEFFRYLALRHSRSIYFDLEYADYSVALAIKSTVDQWVNTLPVKNRGWLRRWAMNDEFVHSAVVPQILSTFPFFLAIVYAIKSQGITPQSSVIIIIVSLLLSRVIFFTSDIFWKRFRLGLLDFIPVTAVNLTKGDSDKAQRKMEKGENRSSLVLGIIGLGASILAGLGSTYIYQWLAL